VVREIEAYMEEATAGGEQFDVVILDPPKLVRAHVAVSLCAVPQRSSHRPCVSRQPLPLPQAPSKKMLDRATIKYTSLNAAAMKVLRPDGLLVTCSCSGAMSQSEGKFREMLCDAARKLRRPLTLLRTASAAPDHVQSAYYREGAYLTCVTARVGAPSG